MTIAADERWASRSWKLDKLKSATSLHEAADYLQDFWDGWIAAPMRGDMAHGGWARLTLACLATEACALYWRPLTQWSGKEWPTPGSGKPVKKSATELASTWAFCWMFREVFRGEEPAGMSIEDLAEVCYRVFRCGLAHRGISKSGGPIPGCRAPTNWLGVIDGQPEIFRSLGDNSRGIISIDPEKFAERVDYWFQVNVLAAMRSGSTEIAAAFKDWCMERWEIEHTHWTF